MLFNVIWKNLFSTFPFLEYMSYSNSRGTGPDAVNRFRPTLLPTLLLTPASRGPRHVSGFYLGRFTLLYQETGEAEAGGGRFIPRLLVVCP
jgi:hypothetical protein